MTGPIDEARKAALVGLHRDLDRRNAAGSDLGCVYVEESRLDVPAALHRTWTHGTSLIAFFRASPGPSSCAMGSRSSEGRRTALLPAMTDDQVRNAARTELCGYWASRRPWMWLSPVIADLGLTSMARGRYAVRTGHLLRKSEAIEQAQAPARVVDQLRARRRGQSVVSPRLRTGWIAWRDARRTIRVVCRNDAPRD